MFLLAIAACGDAVTAAVERGANADLLTMTLDAGQVQLDAANQQMRHSDGRVIELTAGQTELLANEFFALDQLESHAAWAAALQTSGDDSDTCDWHVEECEDAYARMQPAETASLLAGAIDSTPSQALESPRVPGPRAGRAFERDYGRIRIRIARRTLTSESRRADPVTISVYEGTTCADVRAAMDAAREEAVARRSSFKALLQWVFDRVGYTIESGVPVATIGTSVQAAVELSIDGNSTNRVNIAYLMLRGLYQQMGCNGSNDGSVPAPEVPPGMEKECEAVWGTIILPWGQVHSGWYISCELVKAS